MQFTGENKLVFWLYHLKYLILRCQKTSCIIQQLQCIKIKSAQC